MDEFNFKLMNLFMHIENTTMYQNSDFSPICIYIDIDIVIHAVEIK